MQTSDSPKIGGKLILSTYFIQKGNIVPFNLRNTVAFITKCNHNPSNP